MESLNINVRSFSNETLSFQWTINRKRSHYFTFIIPIGIGLFLLLIRVVYDPKITFFGLFLSIIALMFIIIGILFFNSTTTIFHFEFHLKTLKLITIRTQSKFFLRKSTKSYSGMVLEIVTNPPSLFEWGKFYPLKGNKLKIYKSNIIENSFIPNWEKFHETIQRILILSKRLPNPVENQKLTKL